MAFIQVLLALSTVIIFVCCEENGSTVKTNVFATVPLNSECTDIVVCSPPARCVSGMCRCEYPYVPSEHHCILDEKSKNNIQSEQEKKTDSEIERNSTKASLDAAFRIQNKVLLDALSNNRQQEPTFISIASADEDSPTVQFFHLKPVGSLAVLGQNQTEEAAPLAPLSDSPIQTTTSQTFSQSAASTSSVIAPVHFSSPQPDMSQQLPIILQPSSPVQIVPSPQSVNVIELPVPQQLNSGDSCDTAGRSCAGGSVCYQNKCICPQGSFLSESLCKELPRKTGITAVYTIPIVRESEPTAGSLPTSSSHNPPIVDDRCVVPCSGDARCVAGYCSCPQGTAYVHPAGCVALSYVPFDATISRSSVVPAGYACTHSLQCGDGAFCGMGVCRCGLTFMQHGTTCVKRKHLKPSQTSVRGASK
ncbi:hypothetical protein QR680_001674 [Steinernema hermaphroditum]|uniref:EGF-like domain-containing protein n=1 Tax=Steinernema hermaphroditum TaxID=289476 RepID=A0AA39H048_9BILA|nr:hypothetical protein QR680_001674 [Steinernema hermaphroditum]